MTEIMAMNLTATKVNMTHQVVTTTHLWGGVECFLLLMPLLGFTAWVIYHRNNLKNFPSKKYGTVNLLPIIYGVYVLYPLLLLLFLYLDYRAFS